MKKIKSIKQLKEQKRKLAERSQLAEQNIRLQWNSLKENLNPGSIASNFFDKRAQDKSEINHATDNILKSTFTYGLTMLANKFADKAEEKINAIFKK